MNHFNQNTAVLSNNSSKEPMYDEKFFADYYKNIPTGDKSEFLLVIRIVLGGSEMRWNKRLAAWSQSPVKRKLFRYEKVKLTYLTINDQWRKTLELIKSMI